MKYLKTLLFVFCPIIMFGCYPKIDPSAIYIGIQDASPDTLTEMGRAINEKIAAKMKIQLDSSFTNYRIASHPIVYPEYYGGFYLNGSVKPVIIIVGDTSIARRKLSQYIGSNNFILKKGEYSSRTLDSILKTINEKMIDTSLKIYLVRIDTQLNRVVITLDKCSPKNIYRFKKHITDSQAVVFEEIQEVIAL